MTWPSVGMSVWSPYRGPLLETVTLYAESFVRDSACIQVSERKQTNVECIQSITVYDKPHFSKREEMNKM